MKEPNRTPPITYGCEPGWDLSKVDTGELQAEMIRRGYSTSPMPKKRRSAVMNLKQPKPEDE